MRRTVRLITLLLLTAACSPSEAESYRLQSVAQKCAQAYESEVEAFSAVWALISTIEVEISKTEGRYVCVAEGKGLRTERECDEDAETSEGEYGFFEGCNYFPVWEDTLDLEPLRFVVACGPAGEQCQVTDVGRPVPAEE